MLYFLSRKARTQQDKTMWSLCLFISFITPEDIFSALAVDIDATAWKDVSSNSFGHLWPMLLEAKAPPNLRLMQLLGANSPLTSNIWSWHQIVAIHADPLTFMRGPLNIVCRTHPSQHGNNPSYDNTSSKGCFTCTIHAPNSGPQSRKLWHASRIGKWKETEGHYSARSTNQLEQIQQRWWLHHIE